MEEVLDVYTRTHDPEMPLVCLDETSKQLVSETRTPVPMKPGQPERIDYEYERNGTANLLMLFAPLEGFRHVEVTDHRKAVDYAKILKDLSDIHVTGAKVRAVRLQRAGEGGRRALARQSLRGPRGDRRDSPRS